ncbi:uncharacterized protein LOC118511630 isoform X2 [Anopheles stephensi]|uniref:uncharacterized protein LOC118511630 isoform X2 n=1 Tax=Anopheles stephensi TaxID=30069 RepID=UPI0016587E33|nr:uncharacterized protein LOC118511630 isoform X2 [Anopheles stephensi]
MTDEVTLVTCLILTTICVVLGSSIPAIVIRGPRIAVQYERIQLTCFTLTEHKHIQWYFSSDTFDAHYKPSSEVRLSSNRTTLTIRPVDKAHVGSYRCCATETGCASMHLSVLSVLDDHSTLTAPNSGVLDVSNRGNFSIAVYHPPFVGGAVYIDREPSLSFCDHFRTHSRACEEQRSLDTLSYTVRNVTQEDGGQFDLWIHFNRKVERFHLHILVHGSPIAQMEQYNVLQSADHVSFRCRGVAYPAPNVTFSYTPCSLTKMDQGSSSVQSRYCDKSIILPQGLVWLSRIYHKTNFEAIVPSWPLVYGPGIVSCQVANSEGTTTVSTLLYVRNFLD